MSLEQWRDQTYKSRFVFEQVDPNLVNVRGLLDNVLLDDLNLTPGYYTDTRISGTIGVFGSNYIEDSMIRIHHYVDEWDYHKTLGTFFVTDPDLSYEHGLWSGTYLLKSTLYGLQEEEWPFNFAINKGRYTKDVLEEIFSLSNRDFSILSSVRNTVYSSSLVYKVGSNKLTSIYEICNKSNARLGVDGNGIITVKPYVEPSNLTPIFSYDFDANDSMILGKVAISDTKSDVPGRVIAVYTKGDTEISAFVDAPTTSFASMSRRGYRKTETLSISEMSPETKAQATQLASNHLNDVLRNADEYEFDSLYVPLDQGDAVNFTIGGVTRKCLVKNISNNFGPQMKMTIRLKVM